MKEVAESLAIEAHKPFQVQQDIIDQFQAVKIQGNFIIFKIYL